MGGLPSFPIAFVSVTVQTMGKQVPSDKHKSGIQNFQFFIKRSFYEYTS